MRSKLAMVFLAALVAIFAASTALCATGPALLQKGVEAYELAEFEKAAGLLDQALKAGDLASLDRAKAHAYLGLSKLGLGKREEAKSCFAQAKAADSAYKLDPNLHPPSAIKLFEQAKPGFDPQPAKQDPAAPKQGNLAKQTDPDSPPPPQPAEPPAVKPAQPAQPAKPVVSQKPETPVQPEVAKKTTPPAEPKPPAVTPPPATPPAEPKPPAVTPPAEPKTPPAAPATEQKTPPPAEPAASKKPAPPAKPEPAAKPAQPAMPERGYVVEVNKGEVVLDLGKGQGVAVGDRFEAFLQKVIVHPVTKKALHRRVRQAVLVVSQVQQDVSIAKPESGADNLKVGLLIRKLAKAAPKPKPKVASKPAPKPAPKPKKEAKPAPKPAPKPKKEAAKPAPVHDGGMRLVVLTPLVTAHNLENFDEEDYRAARLAKVLTTIPKVKARAITREESRWLARQRINKARYILTEKFDLVKVQKTIGGERKLGSVKKLMVELSRKQVARLARVMDHLKCDAVLIWDVWNDSSGQQVSFNVNVHRKGRSNPMVRARFNLEGYKSANDYPVTIGNLLHKQMHRWR